MTTYQKVIKQSLTDSTGKKSKTHYQKIILKTKNNMKLSSLSKEYAKFKADEAKFEARKLKLNEKVMAELKANGQTSATFPEGILTIVQGTEWIYSKAVDKKKAELDALKEKEQQNGKGEKVNKGDPTVRFTPSKKK